MDKQYPKELLKIKKYPQNLYAIGNVNLLNNFPILAIVGSRECTEYGRKIARQFSKEISKAGICIISGLAKGIDTSAHYGAIYEKGRTIAVLGGGLNNIYPKENEWLYKEIINNEGCIITEYENNTETLTKNFPQRNRIISGIATAVFVVEAEHRSGSKITAKYAKQQNKEIFCIPSNIDQAKGIGTSELIMEGATLIINPNQIINKLYSNKNNNNKINMPEQYEKIYEIIKSKPINSNDLSRILKIGIAQITSILTIMELEGYIEQLPGNIFKIK